MAMELTLSRWTSPFFTTKGEESRVNKLPNVASQMAPSHFAMNQSESTKEREKERIMMGRGMGRIL